MCPQGHAWEMTRHIFPLKRHKVTLPTAVTRLSPYLLCTGLPMYCSFNVGPRAMSYSIPIRCLACDGHASVVDTACRRPTAASQRPTIGARVALSLSKPRTTAFDGVRDGKRIPRQRGQLSSVAILAAAVTVVCPRALCRRHF